MLNLSDFSELKLLEALSNVYISIFVFDIKNDDFVAIKSNRHIDVLAEYPVGSQNKMNNVMQNIAVSEHLDAVLEFVDLNTLDERLAGRDEISLVFEGKINGWCRNRFIVIDRAEDGSLSHVMHVVECIDEEKKRENHLLYLSQTDLMTGISNRGHGESRIKEVLNKGQEGAFCLFDVDHFKSINDLYGHAIGDSVLVAIAEAMKAVKREQDVAMRLGGDEFAMYFMDIMSEEEVAKYIQRLFELVEHIIMDITVLKEPVCISMGISFYKENASFDELYKKADNGVYASKRRSGSSMTFC